MIDIEKMNTLFKWPGGKSRELSVILPLIKQGGDIKCYIEPFLGGGAVFFALEPEKAVVNDVNPGLIQTYQQIADSPDKVKTALENISDTRNIIHKEGDSRVDYIYNHL